MGCSGGFSPLFEPPPYCMATIMDLLLGNKIKQLRKARGITQEQLANALGISFQAVSKRETGTALPDITLAPALASYFGVTIDTLFGFNLKELKDKVMEICNEAYKYRETAPERSRGILENGLKQYPDNDLLLNNLLYVMNYSEKPDDTIALCRHLIEITDSDEIKYDALRFLAYAHSAKGNTAASVAAMEQIPELYFTKLSEMAFILTGKPKYEAAEKQKWMSFETLLQMMWKVAECYEAEGKTEAAISETKRALSLISALEGDTKIDRFECYADFYNRQIERLEAKGLRR